MIAASPPWTSLLGTQWARIEAPRMPTQLGRAMIKELGFYMSQLGEAFPGIGTLATSIQATARSVSRLLRQACKLGIIEILCKRGPHGCNLYRAIQWADRPGNRPKNHDGESREKTAQPDSRVRPNRTRESGKENREITREHEYREFEYPNTTPNPENAGGGTRVTRARADTREREARPPAAPSAPPPGFFEERPAVVEDRVPEEPPGFWDGYVPAEPRPEDLVGPYEDSSFDPADRAPPPRSRRPEPPLTPNRPPEQRQAPSERPRGERRRDPVPADAELVRTIWNEAVRGTKIPPIIEMPPARVRVALEAFRVCRGDDLMWRSVCGRVARTPNWNGGSVDSKFPDFRASLEWLVRTERVLPLVELILSEVQARDEELKAQGIYNPREDMVWSERLGCWMAKRKDGVPSTPEELSEKLAAERRERKPEVVTDPKLIALRDRTPVLTRAQILAIDKTAGEMLGDPTGDPETEARRCARVVLLMMAAGDIPPELGGGEAYFDVRS